MIRSMQEKDSLKQVGFFIRYSKLKKSLSSGVISKSPNNITFSYVSKYMERLLDKLSKIKYLVWSGGLYAPTISNFLKRRFIIRKRTSLSSSCEFSCFTGMLSLTSMHRPPPKLSLSCLNILYPAKWNWLFGQKLSIFVSDTKNISNALKTKGFSNSNLFLREFLFRRPTVTFFGFSNRNDLVFKRQFLFKLLKVASAEKESFNSSL